MIACSHTRPPPCTATGISLAAYLFNEGNKRRWWVYLNHIILASRTDDESESDPAIQTFEHGVTMETLVSPSNALTLHLHVTKITIPAGATMQMTADEEAHIACLESYHMLKGALIIIFQSSTDGDD